MQARSNASPLHKKLLQHICTPLFKSLPTSPLTPQSPPLYLEQHLQVEACLRENVAVLVPIRLVHNAGDKVPLLKGFNQHVGGHERVERPRERHLREQDVDIFSISFAQSVFREKVERRQGGGDQPWMSASASVA